MDQTVNQIIFLVKRRGALSVNTIGASLVKQKSIRGGEPSRMLWLLICALLYALPSCGIYVNVHYYVIFVSSCSSLCQVKKSSQDVSFLGSPSQSRRWTLSTQLPVGHECADFNASIRAIWLLDTKSCGAFMQSHQFDVNSRLMSSFSFAASAGGEVAAT